MLLQDKREQPKVKIGDFGLARAEAVTSTSMGKGAMGVGTPVYMAPELFDVDDEDDEDDEDDDDDGGGGDAPRRSDGLDRASTFREASEIQRMVRSKVDLKAVDLYALGVILWQLWFKIQNPWGKNKQVHSIMRLVVKGKRPPMRPKPSVYAKEGIITDPARMPPPPPDSLLNLIEQCWAQTPDARPNVEAVFSTFHAEVQPQLAGAIGSSSSSSSSETQEFSSANNLAGGGGGGGASAAAAAAPALSSSLSSEAAGSLPYGGDLQTAMRAQDRAAIRTIMTTHRQNSASAGAGGGGGGTGGGGGGGTGGGRESTSAAAPSPEETAAAFAPPQPSTPTGTAAAASSGSGGLPYGGDLQAAMRAQDRPAIRMIMNYRQRRARRTTSHRAQESSRPSYVSATAVSAVDGGGGNSAGSRQSPAAPSPRRRPRPCPPPLPWRVRSKRRPPSISCHVFGG